MLKIHLTTYLLVFFALLGDSVHAQPGPQRLSVLQCFRVSDNLATGHVGRARDRLQRALQAKDRELQGLSYTAVLPWTPRRRDAVHRFLIEKLRLENPIPLPAFDRTQQLGRATIPIRDIRFSQVNCGNMSQDGRYSVVGNARAIRDGTLDPSKLPTIRVWRDTQGRVWTLDHRRLAAMRLSGAMDNVTVEFVSEELVRAQQFKFGTRDEGRSILIQLDEPEATEQLSILVSND